MKSLKKYLSCLYLISFLYLSMVFNTPCFASVDGLDDWYHGSMGYESALVISKTDETPLILFFYSDSDTLCQKLGEDYFSKYEVYSFLADIPKVDINIEGNDFEIELAKKYNTEKDMSLMIIFPFTETDPIKISPFLKNSEMTPAEFIENIKNAFSLTYNNLGYSFLENQDYENAVKYYELSIKYDPERAYTVFALASVYHTRAIEEKDKEYLEKAEEYYEMALEIQPDYEECRAELEKLKENRNKLGDKE